MKILAAALSVLMVACASGFAQDVNGAISDVRDATRSLSQRRQQAVANTTPKCDASGCKCPRGPNGMPKLRVWVYAPIQTEFIEDRMADAAFAYGQAGVMLERTNPGTATVTLGPTRIRTGKDLPGVAVENIDAMDALCSVVADAWKREPADANSVPVFFLKLGTQFKKSVFPETVGVTLSHGLKTSCDQLGVSGVPDRLMAIVDMEPDPVIKQVAAHEIGHAIGMAAGSRLFADIADPSARDIMVTERAIERPDMLLNPAQVGVLCSSRFVSSAP